jgi:hypothetical protein
MIGTMNLRDIISEQHSSLNGFQASKFVASKVAPGTCKIKHMLHTKLIESLDLYALENMNNLELRATIE